MLTQPTALIAVTMLVLDGTGTPADLDGGALPTGQVRRNGVTDSAVVVTATRGGVGDYTGTATVPAYASYDTAELVLRGTAGGATVIEKQAWTVLPTVTETELENDFTAAAANITVTGGGNGVTVIRATGTSASYHEYDDTDTDSGSTLNTGDLIKVFSGENAHGLGWNLLGVRLGSVNTASVVILPGQSGQDAADLSGCTVNMVQDGDRLLVRLDWPSPLTDAMLPMGNWYISVRYSMDGETDNTSRLLVVRL